MEDAPALRLFMEEEFANAWSLARNRIIICTGLNERLLPKMCPDSVEQTLDWKFWPGPPENQAFNQAESGRR